MQTFNMLIPHELYAPFIKQKYAYTIAVLKYILRKLTQVVNCNLWRVKHKSINLAPVQETASNESVVDEEQSVQKVTRKAALVTTWVMVEVLDWEAQWTSAEFSLWLHHLPQHPAIYRLITNDKQHDPYWILCINELISTKCNTDNVTVKQCCLLNLLLTCDIEKPELLLWNTSPTWWQLSPETIPHLKYISNYSPITTHIYYVRI